MCIIRTVRLFPSKYMWDVSTDLLLFSGTVKLVILTERYNFFSGLRKCNLLLPQFLVNEEFLSCLPWYLWPCRTLNWKGKVKASLTLALLAFI